MDLTSKIKIFVMNDDEFNLKTEKILKTFSYFCFGNFLLFGLIVVPLLIFNNLMVGILFLALTLFSCSLAWFAAKRHSVKIKKFEQSNGQGD